MNRAAPTSANDLSGQAPGQPSPNSKQGTGADAPGAQSPIANRQSPRESAESAEAARKARQGKARMGRPPKLTLALVELVAADIGLGMTHKLACIRHGVDYQTWISALKRKPDFALAVGEANADWLHESLQVINLGLPGDTGRRWLAERRFHEFQKTDVVVNASQTVAVNVITPEQQQQIAQYARRLDYGLKGGRN